MKRFKEFLVEGRQTGPLYHYTSPGNLNEILSRNTLGDNTTMIGHGIVPNDYISFTRNKNFHKSQKLSPAFSLHNPGTDVSIELDGNKISNNHKIRSYRDTHHFAGQEKRYGSDESEERLEGNIQNIKDYVKKIRIHKPILKHHLEELESHGIPISHDYKLKDHVNSPEKDVKLAVAQHPKTEEKDLDTLSGDDHHEIRSAVAQHPSTNGDRLHKLLKDEAFPVRLAAIQNDNCEKSHCEKASNDSNSQVSAAAKWRLRTGNYKK